MHGRPCAGRTAVRAVVAACLVLCLLVLVDAGPGAGNSPSGDAAKFNVVHSERLQSPHSPAHAGTGVGGRAGAGSGADIPGAGVTLAPQTTHATPPAVPRRHLGAPTASPQCRPVVVSPAAGASVAHCTVTITLSCSAPSAEASMFGDTFKRRRVL